MVGGGAVGLKRLLILEDGTVFEGKAFGAEGNVVGEVVFTTGMTGYQEAITDQSFNGQMITFTYPLVGNTGSTEMIMNPLHQPVKVSLLKSMRGLLQIGVNK